MTRLLRLEALLFTLYLLCALAAIVIGFAFDHAGIAALVWLVSLGLAWVMMRVRRRINRLLREEWKAWFARMREQVDA